MLNSIFCSLFEGFCRFFDVNQKKTRKLHYLCNQNKESRYIMENQQNKFLAVTYKLYTEQNGNEQLIEEATLERPFVFLSGFGVALDAFEQQILATPEDGTFDFVIKKEDAYGDIDPERILELPKDTFMVDGKFDDEHVKVDAQIPLQNEEGQRFWGRVKEIAEDFVTIDMNHPLANQDLHFIGTVIENRDANEKEIKQMIDMISGADGCGGCGGCSDGNCGEGGCGGGNCGGGCC